MASTSSRVAGASSPWRADARTTEPIVEPARCAATSATPPSGEPRGAGASWTILNELRWRTKPGRYALRLDPIEAGWTAASPTAAQEFDGVEAR
jgi:hypothetical protein